MSKIWNFDQPLDDVTPTSSNEERAKIAALFQKQGDKPVEEVDYGAAFEEQYLPRLYKSNSHFSSTIGEPQSLFS